MDPVNDKFVLNSANYISSYRSALKWHYKQKKVEYPSEFNADMSRFADGFKRIKAGRKDAGEEPAEEGKSPMQFTGYEWLATKAMKAVFDFKSAIFSWVFLLLSWNLISRGKNVGKLNFEHIGWEDDSLTIKMIVKKHDQEGKDTKAKHVFANPIMPYICPVLALAVFVFCMGQRRPGSAGLVFGNNKAEGRFSRWLREILRINESILLAMGIFISMIGTHSFRKGNATWLMGMVDGPSGISVTRCSAT